MRGDLLMNATAAVAYICGGNELDPYLTPHTKINHSQNRVKYEKLSSKRIEEIKLHISQGGKAFSKQSKEKHIKTFQKKHYFELIKIKFMYIKN